MKAAFIESKKMTGFLDVFFQLLVFLMIYVALTGAFPFLGWTFLKPHPDLKKVCLFGFWVLSVGWVFGQYLKNPEKTFSLEPLRMIRALFCAPPYVFMTLLVGAYYLTQLLSQSVMNAAMQTAVWDLGFFDQVLWNTAYADFMITSVRGGFHVYVEHFKPILILVAGLYKLVPSVYFLFAVTTALISLSLAGVYKVSRELTGCKQTAYVFAVCAFFYLPMRNGINFPFHSQTLADPLILFGFFYLLKKRLLQALFFLLLAMMCKQNIILAVLGIGAFAIYKNNKLGWWVIAAAGIYLLYYLKVIEPEHRYELHFRDKWTFFTHLSLAGSEGWQKLLTPNPIVFLSRVLGPFLFFSLFCRGGLLLLGPLLLMHLLSSYEGLRIISAHYTAGLNALVFISAIYGYQSLYERGAPLWNKWRKHRFQKLDFSVLLQIGLFLAAVFFAGLPQSFSIDKNLDLASKVSYQKVIKVLDTIPSDYSVLTNERFAPKLSHRAHLYVFFSMFRGAPYEKYLENPDLIITDEERIHPPERELVSEMLAGGYQTLFEMEGLKIHAHPARAAEFQELTAEWAWIRDHYQGIPYRDVLRKVFMIIFVCLAGLLLTVFIKRAHAAAAVSTTLTLQEK